MPIQDMHIKEITIKNFKGIEKLRLQMKPGVNLLTGDNGAGKSSVLEAIAVALNGLLGGVNGVSVRGIHEDDIRFSINSAGDASVGIQYFKPTAIGCVLDIDGSEFVWERSREDETSRRNTRMDDKRICKYMEELTNDMDSVLPLLCFEGAARVWQSRRGDFGKELKKKLNDRRAGYVGCLDYSMDVKGILQWCLKMEMAEYQKKKKIREYEAFKDIISIFMQKMCGLEEKPEVYYSVQQEEMVYREWKEDMLVSSLSAGYQSLLWMVMNMAYRLAILNPSMGSDLRSAPGVVLIDEIDMHLHPKWQWNVLTALRETFPNIQIIAATHSPIVISSCKDGQLIKIDQNQEALYLPDAYGYSVKDVLELRQQSVEKPQKIQAMLDGIEKARNCDDYQAAAQLANQLETELGEDDLNVKRVKEELVSYRWIQEN